MFLILLFLKSNINMIVNLHNPVPILQQKPSSITTNTLIPKNFQQTNDEVSIIINKNTEKDNGKSINQKISSDIIEFFNDFYEKPDNEKWLEYLIKISTKNNRLKYIGILFILIAIFIFFNKN
jgi:hypothetical protein